MTTEQYIVSLIENSYPGIILNDKDVLEGLRAYVSDNHLEKVYCQDEMSGRIISDFIAPLLATNSEAILSYFKNYSIVNRLKRISNKILELAIFKATYQEFVFDENIEKDFLRCANNVKCGSALNKSLDMLISETILELDYLKGKSDKYSIRMAEKLVNK